MAHKLSPTSDFARMLDRLKETVKEHRASGQTVTVGVFFGMHESDEGPVCDACGCWPHTIDCPVRNAEAEQGGSNNDD